MRLRPAAAQRAAHDRGCKLGGAALPAAGRARHRPDQGFDTVDANTRLGFAIDARDFGVAARMLELLGITSLRLLTNNPAKVAGLEAEGVHVTERLPLSLPANPFNERYLATKRDRTGHDL
jgi:GTP cyclohydrolase II